MDFYATIFFNIILTAVAYMLVPIILLLHNQEKFEKQKAKKIALWNSIIVGAIFCIATIEFSDGDAVWSASPAFLYYWINSNLLSNKEYKKEHRNYIPDTNRSPSVGIPLEQPSKPRCTPKPKGENAESYHAELFYLYTTMRKKKEEIKKNKIKRLAIASLGFIAFYAILLIVGAKATGIEVVVAIIEAVVIGIAHVAINAPIFNYLESLNDKDLVIVDRLKNQIKEIEQNTKRW